LWLIQQQGVPAVLFEIPTAQAAGFCAVQLLLGSSKEEGPYFYASMWDWFSALCGTFLSPILPFLWPHVASFSPSGV
jgi:hypothetical protein